MIETFTVPARIKRIAFGLMLIGLLGVILGFIVYHDHPVRVWADLLVCSYYSIGIALGATFFIASHQIGLGGWHVLIRRIPEAFGAYLPVGGILLLLTIGGGIFFDHHLYHWMVPGVMDPKNHDFYDSVLAGKQGFLNIPFFSFRILCYVVLWSGAAFLVRNISRKEDEVGIQSTYRKSRVLAALFIVIFAVTESTGAWDIMMSTDPHWYSTLFGWYNFASYTVAAFSTIALIITYVKSLGYLQKVNEDHLHNVAMFMFGFSVFWAYLWFSQFMLIWYANMPEETAYFNHRFERPLFNFLFFFNLLVNFFLPFFFLMRRSAKRNWKRVCTVAICLLIGHFVDFYLMVVPNSTADRLTASVSSYNSMTGALSVDVSRVAGYGTSDKWMVNLNDPSTKPEGKFKTYSHNSINAVPGKVDLEVGKGLAYAPGQNITLTTNHGGFGWLELSIIAGFVGLFLSVVLNALTKASLVPVNNPYLKESIQTHTIK